MSSSLPLMDSKIDSLITGQAVQNGRLNFHDKALALYEKAIIAAPDSAGVYAARSNTFRLMGNLEAALADARKAIELAPAQREGWIKLSHALVQGKQYDEALSAIDRAIELAPKVSGLYTIRARIHESQGRLEKALADRTASIECDPTQSFIYKRRGEAHFNLGHYDEALADIARSIELNPHDHSNLMWIPPNRVAACPSEGFRKGLLELADKTVELTDHGLGACATRGWLLAEFGQEEKALADLKTVFDVLAKDDELDGHLYELSNLCGHLVHRQEMVPYLAKMAGIQRRRSFVSYWVALVQLGAGQLDLYRDVCRGMVQLFQGTESPTKAYWVAWTCLLGPEAVDDYAPVVRLAEQAVEADPDSEAYLNAAGGIFYRAGRLEQAIERLTEADNLIEDPETASTSLPGCSFDIEVSSAYTWFFLAMAHHELGHDAEAEKWFDKAIEWTDKVLREHEQQTTRMTWNRRLTLKLFRREAESMLESDAGESSEKSNEETAPPPATEDTATDEQP